VATSKIMLSRLHATVQKSGGIACEGLPLTAFRAFAVAQGKLAKKAPIPLPQTFLALSSRPVLHGGTVASNSVVPTEDCLD